MSFGSYIEQVLETHHKTTVWLEQQTGIRRSTMQHWKDPNAIPRPQSVRKIANLFDKEFRIQTEETARAAGYVLVPSGNNEERMARLAAAGAASPDIARQIDRILSLSPDAQEEMVRYIDAWFIAHRQRQKSPQGSR